MTLARDQEVPREELTDEALAAARDAAQQEDAMEGELHAIAEQTAKLLGPALGSPQIRQALDAKREAVAEAGAGGHSLMLLLDTSLAGLPVETLPQLRGVGTLARDFSAHVLYHRLAAATQESSVV